MAARPLSRRSRRFFLTVGGACGILTMARALHTMSSSGLRPLQDALAGSKESMQAGVCEAWMGRPRLPVARKFSGKYKRGTAGECWEWHGAKHDFGYGLITEGPRAVYAHRVSWEFFMGPIPDGLLVLHVCDNPPCVNPAHLFLGTHEDNVRDMVQKGRHGYGGGPGEKCNAAKLTRKQVGEIRSRRSAGEKGSSIAKDYGVTVGTVYHIANKLTWKEDHGR